MPTARRLLSTAAPAHAATTAGSPLQHLSTSRVFKPNPLRDSILPTDLFQASLMRLPIPELGKTCSRYLSAVTPLVTTTQLSQTETLLRDFESGVGPKLQLQLQERDRAHAHTSYISAWWFEEYLKGRKPLPINMNPYLVLRNDPSRPSQVSRAAGLIHAALAFRRQLLRHRLLPEIFEMDPPAYTHSPAFQRLLAWLPRSRATVLYMSLCRLKAFPLDMSQYPSLFNTTRIPGVDSDRLQTSAGDHIVVLRNGHVYTIPVLLPDGSIFDEGQIAARLAAVLAADGSPPDHSVGVLTSTDRDAWAKARTEMESDPINAESLRTIDSALFVVCLDGEGQSLGPDPGPLAHQLLHNRGVDRWFDKSLSLIVRPDGVAGINFEHSWGDGVAVLRFAEDVFNASLEASAPRIDALPAPTGPVQRLEWRLTPSVQAAIQVAHRRLAADVKALRLDIMLSTEVGKKVISKAGARPDPFMQLAIQLAYYRIHRVTHSVYESCSTAVFKHGRTECIRGASIESSAFTAAMDDASQTAGQRIALLHAALAKHAQLSKDAKMGQGVDRHLYALQRLGAEGGHIHPLFGDAAYSAMKADMLSTSSLFSDALMLGGFGPVSPGYGVGYAADTDLCLFHVTSWQHSTRDFCDAIQSALRDMLALLAKKSSSS